MHVEAEGSAPNQIDETGELLSSFLDGAPIQAPEIFAGHKLDSDSDIAATRRALPGDSRHRFFPRISPHNLKRLSGLGRMLALNQCAVLAHQHRFGVLLPGAANFF